MPTERVDPLLSVSAMEALRQLRVQRAKNPGLASIDLAELIKKISVDAAGLEFALSISLDILVPDDSPAELPHAFFRICIRQLLLRAAPRWTRAVTLGRERFTVLLDRDEIACFRAARLLEDPPDNDVVDWWDNLGRLLRKQLEEQKLDRSRVAERLTLDHENDRLKGLGLTRKARWIAIEDNTAGYDVLSYDVGPEGPVNKLIEVKSSIASPLRFFVTRNEWEKALQFGDSYLFHIWDLASQAPRLHIRTVKQIAPHIPMDRVKGRWSNAEIPLSAQ